MRIHEKCFTMKLSIKLAWVNKFELSFYEKKSFLGQFEAN